MLAQLVYGFGLFKLFERMKLKKCLTNVTLTEFWKLNASCNISPETAELRIWMTLEGMMKTHICGEQDFQMSKRKEWQYATL